MKWFRFHSDVVHDPKVLRLPVKLRWRWVELLCLANQSEPRGYLPPIEDIALMLRVSERDVSASLEAIAHVGLIDITPEHVRPHNWEKWQPNSDNAAERMANRRRTSSEHVQPVIEHVRSREEEKRSEGEKREEGEQTDAATLKARIDIVAASFARYGTVTAGTPDAISYSVKDYGIEWVERAVRVGAGASVEGRPGWNYIESILERWQKQGGPDDDKPSIQPHRQFTGGVRDTSANATERAEARLRA